jgi:hypothetical protein
MLPDIRKALVKFAAISDEIARRFSKMAKQRNFNVKVASVRIPEVVELLVKKGLADPAAKNLLANSLRDHVKCLHYIEKLAERISPGRLGSVVYGSNSAIRRQNKNVVGLITPEDQTESGRAFKEAMLRISPLT